MQELASLTWTPGAWSCYSGMGAKFPLIATGVEDALDVTMAQEGRIGLPHLQRPLAYAELILNGEPEEYLKNVAGSHGLED